MLFEKPKILGHILVTDFASAWTFKTSSINSNIAFLDAFTEEGLSSEATYMFDFKESKKLDGLKGGIIAVINPEGFFADNVRKKMKGYLLRGGFFSRNNIASYDIPESIVWKVLRSISKGNYRMDKYGVSFVHLKFPSKRVDVYIREKHAELLTNLSLELKKEYERELDSKLEMKGFRLSKSLISLAKASALRDGRKFVSENDIDRIYYLSQWMNLKFEPLKSRYLRDDYD